jgi:D-3-phosphoglycerate dehydrogenase/C-terminal binding protein
VIVKLGFKHHAKVIITDFISAGDTASEQRILEDVATVEAMDAHHESELIGRIEDADAIMLYHNLSLTRAVIERLDRCKLIVRCGVGYDNVDHALARARGIDVANVPDYGTEEVADSAIGMTLTLTRGIHYLNSRLRSEHQPWMYTQAVPLQRLRTRVFGIVGLGRIGTAAALRAKALGMDVAFYDPLKPDGFDKALGIRRVSELRELFEQAAVLSLHCPLTTQTRHMVNSESIEWLSRGTYLVNTARGAVVDTRVIPAAIASGRLAGAGIDVLDGEPPRPDDPLISAWRNPDHPAHHRVIINPHSAFYSEQGLLDMRIKGSHACRNALLGKPVLNVINAAGAS